MKKTRQLLIRLSPEDYEKINELCIAENTTISAIIRDLIKFRHSYLKKNKKLIIKDNTTSSTTSNNVIDQDLLNEFKRLMS